MDWESFGIDPRLCDALRNLGLYEALPIQKLAIPEALAHNDILCQSFTGSGKTVIYLTAILHRILQGRSRSVKPMAAITALIVVPTRELCRQLEEVLLAIIKEFSSNAFTVTCAAIYLGENSSAEAITLRSMPEILISTPSLVMNLIKDSKISLKNIVQFVCDEADLIFDMDYGPDLEALLEYLPASAQKFFLSATLDQKLENIVNLHLRSPKLIKLEETEQKLLTQPVQHLISLDTTEKKYMLIYALVKLQILRGYIVIFVNSVTTAYKLKLFLYRFGQKAFLYNPELPVSTRQAVIEGYNLGAEYVLIAVDDSIRDSAKDDTKSDTKDGTKASDNKETEGVQEADSSSMATKAAEHDPSTPAEKQASAPSAPKEAGIFRGLDFTRVDVVLNFDCPVSSINYIHRIGRTARGANPCGHAITIIHEDSKDNRDVVLDVLRAQREEFGKELLAPFQFNIQALESFRYRVVDVLHGLTPSAIKEYRLSEIKAEILASDSLRKYFSQQSKDMALIKRIKTNPLIERQRQMTMHLKFVPSYLLPNAEGIRSTYQGSFAIGSHKTERMRRADARAARAMKQGLGPVRKPMMPRRGIGKGRGKGKLAEPVRIPTKDSRWKKAR